MLRNTQLENNRFGTNAEAKCDWRVNFSSMWGNVGLRKGVSMREVLVREPHPRKGAQTCQS